MTPVYKEFSLIRDGIDDSLDACLASILDKPLSDVSTGVDNDPVVWGEQWKLWFANQGLSQEILYTTEAPSGYSIASLLTSRVYPENSPRAGQVAPYGVVMYNGEMLHDPHLTPVTGNPDNYTIEGYFYISPVYEPTED